MDVKIRPVRADELETYALSMRRVFGDPIDEEQIRIEAALVLEANSRTLAAFDEGEIVGTMSCHAFRMNVPGGRRVPTAGVSDVTTRATHRRRGVMSRLMARSLNESRENGQPLAALWASESNIYGRFGFGMAVVHEDYIIERKDTAFAQEDTARGLVRFVEPGKAAQAFAEPYARACNLRGGMIERNDLLWRVALLDSVEARLGMTENYHAIYEEDGRIDGYALYRLDATAHLLRVAELVAATDAAYSSLWRFCLSIDLMDTFRAVQQPSEAPLPWMMAAPRKLRRNSSEEFWLRIVDAEAALSARTYARDGQVTFELRDRLCDWNDGVIALEGGPNGASCRRSNRGADLALTVADLGAAYLGAVNFSTLASAGRVEERTLGALRRADTMFATELKPWCVVQF